MGKGAIFGAGAAGNVEGASSFDLSLHEVKDTNAMSSIQIIVRLENQCFVLFCFVLFCFVFKIRFHKNLFYLV